MEQPMHKQFFQRLQKQQFKITEEDYIKFENEINLIKHTEIYHNGIYRIFDCKDLKYLYVSDNYYKIFEILNKETYGINDSFIREDIHYEDREIISATSLKFIDFLFSLPAKNRTEFKAIAEYRVLNGKGNYFRVLSQDRVLKQCNNGYIWLLLNVIDVAPEQDLNSSAKITFYDLLTNKVLVSSQDIKQKIFSEKFTKREVEILKCLSFGSSSKQIADQLFISVNTVNNHRRNIISKLNIQNTSEAITIASNLGLI